MKKNTKESGILRFFVYYDKKETEFVGVCLELGIVKSGDNPFFIQKDLKDAAIGYLQTIKRENLSDDLLNQQPPKEYISIFNSINKMLKNGKDGNKIKNVDLDDSDKTPQAFLLAIRGLCHISC